MPYKLFLSANDDPTSQQYVEVARAALFRINEFPILPVALSDVAGVQQDRWDVARRLIQEAQIFIGLYTGTMGSGPANQMGAYLELEYNLSQELNQPCFLFMPETLDTRDDRFMSFKKTLEQKHVINLFKDEADLAAKVILALGGFRQAQRPAMLRPGSTGFQPAITAAPPASGESIGAAATREIATTPQAPLSLPLPELVNQAMALASSDIEQIVRRALELHDAQKTVQEQNPGSGWMQVNPIFGQPMVQSQFQSDIFMIMPFRPQFDGIYQDVIRPVCQSLNLSIKRGDDFTSVSGSIINEIWAALNACRLVIVETTEVNANVYYELGIAHTLGKPAVLLTQEKEPQKLPFDIRHLRFVVYENTIPGAEELEKDLHKAIVWLLNDLNDLKENTEATPKP